MTITTYCYWLGPDGVEYEVHYTASYGEIVDWGLYPEPPFTPDREQERAIIEAIYNDLADVDYDD